MYNEDVENESCETRQRRRVIVVTSERYYSFMEPVYVSDHGHWEEPYAYYDIIEINGKNKYVANLIKPFEDLDDIHIAYREISNQTGEYNIEPLEDIIGEYYLIYDSLRNDYHNKIKIPYHLNESAIFEKFLNSDRKYYICKKCKQKIKKEHMLYHHAMNDGMSSSCRACDYMNNHKDVKLIDGWNFEEYKSIVQQIFNDGKEFINDIVVNDKKLDDIVNFIYSLHINGVKLIWYE